MDTTLQESFQQFDSQTNSRTSAHIDLSNLFLTLERGDKKVNRETSNQLYALVQKAYPPHKGEMKMYKWWMKEFNKLPHWNEY